MGNWVMGSKYLPNMAKGVNSKEDYDEIEDGMARFNKTTDRLTEGFRAADAAVDAQEGRDATIERHEKNAARRAEDAEVRAERKKNFDAAENKQQPPSPKSTHSPLAYPNLWLISTQAVRL